MTHDLTEKSVNELLTIIYDQNKMMLSLHDKIKASELELKLTNTKYHAVLQNYYDLKTQMENEFVKYNEFAEYLQSSFPAIFMKMNIEPDESASDDEGIDNNEDISNNDEEKMSNMFISPEGNLLQSLTNVHILDIAKLVMNKLKKSNDDGFNSV